MRVCEGCGRKYVPRSGKQRFCALRCPERPPSAKPLGYNPGSRRPSWPERQCAFCGRTFEPRAEHQRFCTRTCQTLGRRPEERALYDAGHKQDRRRWAPLVATGKVRCSWPGCGRLLEAGESWDLGHLPGGGASPQHSSCNRKTAGRRSVNKQERRVSREW
jgi:hypothetical protein